MTKQVKHLYIHIPFCKTICDYCDFVRELYTDEKAKIYLAHIRKRLSKYIAKQFATIYIGGGTPNCLNTEQLSLLLAHICKYLKNNGEFTVECNPE
jgi:oxygen-independent coproporphyrinogen-3 oxidase